MVQDKDIDTSGERMSKGKWTEVPLQDGGQSRKCHCQRVNMEESCTFVSLLSSSVSTSQFDLKHFRCGESVGVRGCFLP
jgi:hypothetical protein